MTDEAKEPVEPQWKRVADLPILQSGDKFKVESTVALSEGLDEILDQSHVFYVPVDQE